MQFFHVEKKKGWNNPNEFDAFLHVQNQKIRLRWTYAT